MNYVKGNEVPPGLYRVYWRSGGSSLAAVGVDSEGRRWVGACNWLSPCAVDGDGNSVWDDVIGCVQLMAQDSCDNVRDWSEVRDNATDAYTIVQDADAELRAKLRVVLDRADSPRGLSNVALVRMLREALKA